MAHLDRLQEIRTWLEALWPGESIDLQAASSDASFRRYYRVSRAGNTAIVMDAPPGQEDVRPWLAIRARLEAADLAVPGLLAERADDGLLLISDLGVTHLADRLNAETADDLYLAVMRSLVRMQASVDVVGMAPYDAPFLHTELAIFPTWFLERHAGLSLGADERERMQRAFEALVARHLAEPPIFVHRDYHSRNLMLRPGVAEPGIIDFQGALHGPLSYDLVSLLRDAYVAWEEEQVIDWVVRYWELARKAGLPVRADFSEFYRDFEWMGVQRHLKILGIFARLHHRDGKSDYLADMPRVVAYLRAACVRYAALTPLLRLLDRAEQRVTEVGYSF